MAEVGEVVLVVGLGCRGCAITRSHRQILVQRADSNFFIVLALPGVRVLFANELLEKTANTS